MTNLDLQGAKKIMVDILIEIDRICKDNHIDYWISFGTLLGAVRHKGFIPWDDDIDIVMPRKDYNKFTKIAESKLNKKYLFQNKNTNKNHIVYGTKIRHKKSVYVEFGNEERQPNGYNGIFVDIFPLDRVNKKHLKTIVFLKNLYHISPFKQKYKSNASRIFNYSLIFLYPFREVFKIIAEKLFSDDGEIYICGMEVKFAFWHKYKLVYPIKKIEFEEVFFNCPQHEKIILEKFYGDFMTLPPLHQRQIHATEIQIFE